MHSFGKSLKLFILSVLLLTSLFANAQKVVEPAVQPDWVKDYPPFRIAGNLYYVGTYELACYLVATNDGLILINTGSRASVPIIRSHIEKLGFKFGDIKILLANHAHFDHVGGMAEIKRITGAKMMIEEKDAPVLADGGNSDFLFGGKGSSFEPVKADVLLHDKDTVKLGEMQLIVLHHPGHTKGACSFIFDVKDEHRTYRVLIANMPSVLSGTRPGMPTYPNIAEDYGYTFDTMKNLQFDIWFAAHVSQFGLLDKHKPGDAYRPEAFFDQKGYDAELEDLRKGYLKLLDRK
jgi:metallo-beta-lactamase class B